MTPDEHRAAVARADLAGLLREVVKAIDEGETEVGGMRVRP